MVTIQILGTGCSKCGYLAMNAQKAVQALGRLDTIAKVTDIVKMLAFNPMALPALAINGQIVSAGTIPSPEQIQKLRYCQLLCSMNFRLGVDLQDSVDEFRYF